MNILNFVGKLVFFVIALFVLDFSIGSILKHFYFKQNSGLLYRTTYALDSTKADILILGASTANHHYYPLTFEKGLKMSCYNAGRDGNSIFYHYAVLKAILFRYHPKMVILDYNAKEFLQDQESYDRLSSLLPYYDYHPEIRSIIQLKSRFEKYKLVSRIYPYNSALFTIAIGNMKFNKSREYSADENGYVALRGKWQKHLSIDSISRDYKIDSEKVKIFKSLIKECLDSKVKLFICVSPAFSKIKYEDPSIAIAKRIAQEYNISFYDFSNDSFFLNNPNLFHNPGHLNDEGAKVYSEMVINKINGH